MTYLRRERCPHCGEPHWFRYWIGRQCDKSVDGLSVSDLDLLVHRFRMVTDARGERTVEHIMVVELKTEDESLGKAQRDTLSLFNAALNSVLPVDGAPIGVEARPGFIVPGEKKVIWHGVHLLRVPAQPSEPGPFFWDNQPLAAETLAAVLSFRHDPREPLRILDVERRHKPADQDPSMPLFDSKSPCLDTLSGQE